MSVAEDFVAEHPRSILITYRKDGGLQASPVRVMLDEKGAIVATTRAATAKAKNLSRDPRFTLCAISDGWSGPWMTMEGTASVYPLPGALDRLRAFYQQRDGSIPPDDEFRQTMETEGRVIIEFSVVRHTPVSAAR